MWNHRWNQVELEDQSIQELPNVNSGHESYSK